MRPSLKSASVSLSGCSAAKRWKSKSTGSYGEVEVKKTELAALVAAEGRFPMKAVADALE